MWGLREAGLVGELTRMPSFTWRDDIDDGNAHIMVSDKSSVVIFSNVSEISLRDEQTLI